mgnify:CR=1 FL=1
MLHTGDRYAILRLNCGYFYIALSLHCGNLVIRHMAQSAINGPKRTKAERRNNHDGQQATGNFRL